MRQAKTTQKEQREVAKTKELAKWVADQVPTVGLPIHKVRYPKQRRTDQISQVEQSYDQLDGEWHDWLEVARKYEHKVPSQDRYDMRHNILIELARARARDGKPIPILRAYRIASLTVALYWRRIMRQPTLFSLDQPTTDYDGNELRLLDTVADDKAIDLDLQLDASTWRLGCPIRLIEIATKKLDGIPLNKNDQKYLERYRRRTQKSLL